MSQYGAPADDLPEALEDAVLAVIDGDEAQRADGLRALLLAHPRHEGAIRRWLALAGVDVPATAAGPAGPKPLTILKTPGGSTRFMISQMRSTASGASSALFTTTALPATSAGATFSAISSMGTFQGMMAPTTPSGSRTVTDSTLGAKGTLSPFNSPPSPPKNSKTSATTLASTRLSVRKALPVSSAISRPNSSACSFSRAAH
jgi:hypothetical protein